MNVNLSSEILQQTSTSPTEKRCLSFLSLDGADRREAAVTRRLERLVRQFRRLERNNGPRGNPPAPAKLSFLPPFIRDSPPFILSWLI
jgi:hypothetical protein